MTGFLRRRGPGWQLIVSAGFDPKTGKHVQHTRTVRGTKREAEAELVALVVKVNQGMVVDSRASFGDLLDAWLDRARSDLSPSTVRTTQFYANLYIRPSLGKVPRRKLTTAGSTSSSRGDAALRWRTGRCVESTT